MKIKKGNTVISIFTIILVLWMIYCLIYLLIDNTRLEFVNDVTEYRSEQKEKDIDTAKKEIRDLKGDLVEWQNTANGYKWQLEQINDKYFKEDK